MPIWGWVLVGILVYCYMLYRTSGNHPTDRLEDRIKDLEYKVENLENKLEEKE